MDWHKCWPIENSEITVYATLRDPFDRAVSLWIQYVHYHDRYHNDLMRFIDEVIIGRRAERFFWESQDGWYQRNDLVFLRTDNLVEDCLRYFGGPCVHHYNHSKRDMLWVYENSFPGAREAVIGHWSADAVLWDQRRVLTSDEILSRRSF